jgi:SAM-dependent methyltransferase
LGSFPFRHLRSAEQAHLRGMLRGLRGRHIVHLGDAFAELDAPHFERYTRIAWQRGSADVVSGSRNLPLTSDSVDVLVVPHVLETIASPESLLREAYRVLRPEGHIILSGFTPWSILGLVRAVGSRRACAPWNLTWHPAMRVVGWLEDHGFDRTAAPCATSGSGDSSVLVPLRQPIGGIHPVLRRAGGIYIVAARKRESRLRPLAARLRRRDVAVIGFAEASARSSVRRIDGSTNMSGDK